MIESKWDIKLMSSARQRQAALVLSGCTLLIKQHERNSKLAILLSGCINEEVAY